MQFNSYICTAAAVLALALAGCEQPEQQDEPDEGTPPAEEQQGAGMTTMPAQGTMDPETGEVEEPTDETAEEGDREPPPRR